MKSAFAVIKCSLHDVFSHQRLIHRNFIDTHLSYHHENLWHYFVCIFPYVMRNVNYFAACHSTRPHELQALLWQLSEWKVRRPYDSCPAHLMFETGRHSRIPPSLDTGGIHRLAFPVNAPKSRRRLWGVRGTLKIYHENCSGIYLLQSMRN